MRICIEPVTSYGKVCYTDGSLQSATDFAGKTTTFAYYGPTHPAAGKISQMTNPLGKTTTYLYSDLGQVIQEAGTAGYKVTYEYDEYGSKKRCLPGGIPSPRTPPNGSIKQPLVC